MHLQQTSEEILNQLIQLLVEMDDDQYRNPVHTLSKGSIGVHVRHVIEFYECLLKGFESGCVDYDSRQRNTLIENERNYSIQAIGAIISQIHRIPSDRELHISINLSKSGNPMVLPTCFYRELAYNIEHAIHHMALIRIGVEAAYPQVKIREEFGIACSTLRYRKQLCVR